jgi:hypothetical protein
LAQSAMSGACRCTSVGSSTLLSRCAMTPVVYEVKDDPLAHSTHERSFASFDPGARRPAGRGRNGVGDGGWVALRGRKWVGCAGTEGGRGRAFYRRRGETGGVRVPGTATSARLGRVISSAGRVGAAWIGMAVLPFAGWLVGEDVRRGWTCVFGRGSS